MWANLRHDKNGREFTAQGVSLERSYRDASSSLKASKASADERDIARLQLVLWKVFEHLALKEGVSSSRG